MLSLAQPALAAPTDQLSARPTGAMMSAEQKALSEAQRTGEPVPIPDKTTETSVVYANPDGTLKLSSHNQPVRVRRDGAWIAADNSLTQRPDGTLAPKASTSDMTFSGGGNGPLAILKDGAKSVALSWDKPLPRPDIEGNTATYPEVLPGVDLKITANTLGYSHLIVVHNAEAATNPELARIKYRLSGSGLQISESDGTLTAKDDNGTTAIGGSTPIMWDSSRVGKPGATKEIDPANGKVSRLEMTTRTSNRGSTAEVEIKPDHAALTGPDVKYPVYIDPPLSKHRTNWITVTDAKWQTWNTGDWAKVGYCDAKRDRLCGGTSFKARSFFDFPISELNHRNGVEATIWEAGLWATQAHASTGCTSQPTVAVAGSRIDSGTRWPGPAVMNDVVTAWSNAGDQCGGPREVLFSVEPTIRQAATDNSQWVTLGLRAPGQENTMDHWKRFGNNPRLDVVFSYRPNDAQTYSISNAVSCNGQTYTPDASPTLYSTMTDNNEPPLQVAIGHEVLDAATDAQVALTDADSLNVVSSGAVADWQTDVELPDGHYKFKAFGHNVFPGNADRNLWATEPSPFYWFHVRAKPITAIPVIHSEDYRSGYWSRPQNQPGQITFNAAGAKYIKGFSYTFAGSGTEVLPSTTDCDVNTTFTNGGWIGASGGTATITVPQNLAPGRHTLHVRSFDDAHKLSPESQAFEFYIAPSYTTPAPSATYEAGTNSLPIRETTGMKLSVSSDPAASGGEYVLLESTADGASVDYGFQVPVDGDYDVTAGLFSNIAALPDQLTFVIDGKPVSRPFFSSTATSRSDRQQLAGVQLTRGTHTLKVKLSRMPGSTATTLRAGLDFLALSPTLRLDAEAMPVVSAEKPLTHMPNCCGIFWNSGAQQRFDSDEPGKSFSLEFSVPIEADYAVGMGMTVANQHGNFKVSIDGQPIGRTDTSPVVGYAADAGHTSFQSLNGVHLASGKHTIKFTTVSTHPDSTQLRYRIGLDYLTFLPINNVTAASFVDAMNNDGIGANTGPTTALDFEGSGLSAEAMADAGLAPGSTITINGAKFTMPAPNPATGNDNVVAIGQTIPFPAAQQVKASAVGLLVLSTVGVTAARDATITYTDGTTSNPTLSEVDDWVAVSRHKDAITLPYWKEGTKADWTRQPVIRPVFLPTDPNKTLKSITLPNSGASLLFGGASTALHVLAMAPRPAQPGWVGAWAAPADAAVVPPDGNLFTNRTLRTVLKPTVTGAQVRVKLSNVGNDSPVLFNAASIAAQSGTDAATAAAPVALTFSGNTSVTLAAGAEAYSDPIALPTGGNGNLVVSIFMPNGTTLAPMHGSASAPTFLATGNNVADATGASFTTTLNGSYFVSAVDVSTANTSHGTVVVLGDQLSATAPPGSVQRNTWVDHLPGKLNSVGAVLPGGLVNASRAGAPDTGRWKLNEGSGNVARDSAGSAHGTATGVLWSSDHDGSAVFNGSGANIITNAKVLDTTRSFSVSAWVRTRSLSKDQTVVGQDGSNTGAFYLQYSSASKRWTFTLRGSDNLADPSVVRLVAANEATLEWTHLTGTYDAESRIARLYVNGMHAAWTHNVRPFNATGTLAMGRARSGSGVTEWFDGSVSDVRTHQRMLSASDVLLTYQQPNLGNFPNTGALTGSDYKAEIQRSVLSAPNARTVLVALGSTEILRGVPADQVRTSLTDLIKSNEGFKRQQRNDGSALHVVLTTVPALGLDANDPREVQRRQLNSDLMTNYQNFGADHIVDFDAAVRDSGDASKVAPQYLTNGVPNDAYHGRLAEYLAEAVNDFPPRAEL